jgi:hypothetical protein
MVQVPPESSPGPMTLSSSALCSNTLPLSGELHRKSAGATVGRRQCYYRSIVVLHVVDGVATISGEEVLQTEDIDATNGWWGCFQWCSVLLLLQSGIVVW